MRRRNFIAGLGGAATICAWPLPIQAQRSAMPIVGYLSSVSLDDKSITAFRRGLADEGFVEDRNVSVEYRSADGHYERLPGLARELVSLSPSVIVAVTSSPAALAAKAATQTTPIVFQIGTDPVELGLVASYNRPGGNVTGVISVAQLTPKLLELLDELIPKGAPLADLVNQTNPVVAQEVTSAQNAARRLGRDLIIVQAATDSEIDAAFGSLAQQRAAGLVVWSDGFFFSRRPKIVSLAERYRLPTIYPSRLYVEEGGFVGYGNNFLDSRRQTGAYAGQILKGTKPSDLPVVQPTKFELVINLKTAKSLKLDIPARFLAVVDEVIE